MTFLVLACLLNAYLLIATYRIDHPKERDQ